MIAERRGSSALSGSGVQVEFLRDTDVTRGKYSGDDHDKAVSASLR